MKDKFAVIGLGYLGKAIAATLSERGAEVLAIDADAEKVENIKDEVAHAVALDSTDIRALKAQNIHEYDSVVVAMGHNFEAQILTTVLLKELNVKRIVARAANQHQKMILEKVGIKEIFLPDDEVGKTVAEIVLHSNVKGFLLLPDDFEIIEINTPRKIVNKSINQIKLREKYDLNLITIKRKFPEIREGEKIFVEHVVGVPKGDTVLLESDVIILLGKTYDVDKFIEING